MAAAINLDSRRFQEHSFDHVIEPIVRVPEAPKRSIFDFAIPADLFVDAQTTSFPAPQKPWYLLPTHFACSKPLSEIVDELTSFLTAAENDVDFEFVPHEVCFNGMYVTSTSSTDFHIRVYENTGATGYLVEFQRINRASCNYLFNQLMNSARTALMGGDDSNDRCFGTMPMFASDSFDDSCLDDDCEQYVEHVLSQAVAAANHEKATDNTRLEASRIFAEIASDAASRDRMLSCLPSIAKLLDCTACPVVSQNCVLALAGLVQSPAGLAAVRETPQIFPALMRIAKNGPYYSAKMRREAAKVLSVLAEQFAVDIAAVVGKDAVQAWLQEVNELTCPRMKQCCSGARSNLAVAVGDV